MQRGISIPGSGQVGHSGSGHRLVRGRGDPALLVAKCGQMRGHFVGELIGGGSVQYGHGDVSRIKATARARTVAGRGLSGALAAGARRDDDDRCHGAYNQEDAHQ